MVERRHIVVYTIKKKKSFTVYFFARFFVLHSFFFFFLRFYFCFVHFLFGCSVSSYIAYARSFTRFTYTQQQNSLLAVETQLDKEARIISWILVQKPNHWLMCVCRMLVYACKSARACECVCACRRDSIDHRETECQCIGVIISFTIRLCACM